VYSSILNVLSASQSYEIIPTITLTDTQCVTQKRRRGPRQLGSVVEQLIDPDVTTIDQQQVSSDGKHSREPPQKNLSNATGSSLMARLKKVMDDVRSSYRKRLLAIMSFLAFGASMIVVLLSLNAVLSRIPATESLMKEARKGTLSPSLVLVLDGVGFVAVLLLSALAAKIQRQSFSDYGLPLGEAFRKRFWQGLGWGFSLAFLVIGITHVLGGFSFGMVALSPRAIIVYGVTWAISFVLVGLFEEFLYRGYALYTLSTGFGFWAAAVLLSALFAGLHLANAGEGIIGAFDVMLYSVFACFTLKRTGTLWFAVGLHAAWDFSLTFIYSVPGSGLHATGHLLCSRLHGPAWLTGGSAGPEGSAVGLVVLGLSFWLFPKLFPGPRLVGETSPPAE
jgi:uncharacterized protein